MLCLAMLTAAPWDRTRLAVLTYNKLDGSTKSQMMMLFQLNTLDAEVIVTMRNSSLAAALVEDPRVVLKTGLLSPSHTVTKAELEFLDKTQYEAAYTELLEDFKDIFALFQKHFKDYESLQMYLVRPTAMCPRDSEVEECIVTQ